MSSAEGWTDSSTGYVNAAARWYNPANGAFTSADSVSNPPTPAVNANPYAYANDNPLGNSDTTGHDACASDDIKAQEQAYEEMLAKAAAEQKREAAQFLKNVQAELARGCGGQRRPRPAGCPGAGGQRAGSGVPAAVRERVERRLQRSFRFPLSSSSSSSSYYSSNGSGVSDYWYYGGAAAVGAGAGYYAYSSLPSAAEALGEILPEVGRVILSEVEGASALDLLGFALAASTSDDCSAHGIPKRSTQQNLGGVNSSPVIGTTPAEDTTAAAGHLATSSVAVADTSTSTASSGGLGGGGGAGSATTVGADGCEPGEILTSVGCEDPDDTMRRAVKETYGALSQNPALSNRFLSPSELEYLRQNPGMGQANFGKALERAVAQHPDIEPYFMQIGGGYMPDFVGTTNSEMYEVTTETLDQMVKHFARSYVNPVTYVTYPSVPWGFGAFS